MGREKRGCRRPEDVALVLAQLLREDGRVNLGRGRDGSAAHRRLPGGAARAPTGRGSFFFCLPSSPCVFQYIVIQLHVVPADRVPITIWWIASIRSKSPRLREQDRRPRLYGRSRDPAGSAAQGHPDPSLARPQVQRHDRREPQGGPCLGCRGCQG